MNVKEALMLSSPSRRLPLVVCTNKEGGHAITFYNDHTYELDLKKHDEMEADLCLRTMQLVTLPLTTREYVLKKALPGLALNFITRGIYGTQILQALDAAHEFTGPRLELFAVGAWCFAEKDLLEMRKRWLSVEPAQAMQDQRHFVLAEQLMQVLEATHRAHGVDLKSYDALEFT